MIENYFKITRAFRWVPFERIFKFIESLIAWLFIQLLVTTGKITKARAFAFQCKFGLAIHWLLSVNHKEVIFWLYNGINNTWSYILQVRPSWTSNKDGKARRIGILHSTALNIAFLVIYKIAGILIRSALRLTKLLFHLL